MLESQEQDDDADIDVAEEIPLVASAAAHVSRNDASSDFTSNFRVHGKTVKVL
jgi:hypothetical protein